MGFFDVTSGPGLVTVKVSGLDRLRVYMEKLMVNMPVATRRLTKAYADDVVAFAKNNVQARSRYDPVDYGRNAFKRHRQGTLRDSINILKVNDSKEGRRIVIGIEPSSDATRYAAAVENGRAGGKTIKLKWTKAEEGYYQTAMAKFRAGETMKFPKRRKYLMFWWKKTGKKMYLNKIIQGAQKPMYYMRDGVLQAEERMIERLENETAIAMRKK